MLQIHTFVNYAIFFSLGFGFVDFGGKIKVNGKFSGERMRFKQRRLKFSLDGLDSGVEYKVKCSAYKDDTPDEIGESTTTFKVQSRPGGGNIALSLRWSIFCVSKTHFLGFIIIM